MDHHKGQTLAVSLCLLSLTRDFLIFILFSLSLHFLTILSSLTLTLLLSRPYGWPACWDDHYTRVDFCLENTSEILKLPQLGSEPIHFLYQWSAKQLILVGIWVESISLCHQHDFIRFSNTKEDAFFFFFLQPRVHHDSQRGYCLVKRFELVLWVTHFGASRIFFVMSRVHKSWSELLMPGWSLIFDVD